MDTMLQSEHNDSCHLGKQGNWIEDNKLKVWEKDLHITPPNEMSLIVDTKLQNIELWNKMLDGTFVPGDAVVRVKTESATPHIF